MNKPADLFDDYLATLKPEMVEKFEQFDRQNPIIYDLIKRYVGEAIAAGRRRIGIAAIFERIRWHLSVETAGDEFKLNNNYRAFYARKFVRDYPQYAEIFETRSSIADGSKCA